MAKTTIIFTPKRSIISPAPPDDGQGNYDPYTIEISLESFDRSSDLKKSEAVSLSGIMQQSLYYDTEQYSCKTVTGAIKVDGSGQDNVSTAEMKMFFKSVLVGEYFSMTNIDTNEVMSVQMTSRPQYERVSKAHLNEFKYSFTVREATE